MVSLSRLIRLPNLLIIAATQLLTRQCILLPILDRGRFDLQLPGGLFVLLVLATVFTAAGGYAINDYFDRKMDQVNRPQSLIVGKLIYPRHAMAYHLIFTISGIIMGAWVAYRTELFFLSVIFIMVSGLLWFYSTTYKRELLLGNIIVSLMIGMVAFLVLVFELPLLARAYGSDISPLVRTLITWVSGFSLFAFLLNLIREIVKDAEDFEGDQAFGKNTIPVVWGMRTMKQITVVLIVITAILLAATWKFLIPGTVTFLYFLLLFVVPLAFVVILVVKGDDRKTFHSASTLLKLIMTAGLIFMIVANLIIRTTQ
jgi:4-hydroxybenzoate polyprenyltransferase